MIVDIYGLPGSGKTYLADQLAASLSGMNATSFERTTIPGKLLSRLCFFGIRVLPSARKLEKELGLLVNKANPSSLFGIYENTDYCIRSLTVSILKYGLLGGKKGTYLFDEGILHTLVKLYGDTDISLQELAECTHYVLEKLKETKCVFVYNHYDVNKCIEAMHARNRRVCQFDSLDELRLTGIMNRYAAAIEVVNHAVEHLVIVEREDTLDAKITKILR